MQYMLMIYEDEAIYAPNKSGPVLRDIVGKHRAFSRDLGSAMEAAAGSRGR